MKKFLHIAATAMSLSILAAPSVAADPPSAAIFVAEPDYRAPAISPDGRYLAFAKRIEPKFSEEETQNLKLQLDKRGYRRAAEGRKLLSSLVPNEEAFILDLQNRGEPRVIELGGRHVRAIEWASDKRVLITVSQPIESGYNMYSGSRILSIDVETGAFSILFDDNRRVLRSNINLTAIVNRLPDDPDHVLMAADRGDVKYLWRVNVVDGSAEEVARGDHHTITWITAKNGDPFFRLDTNRLGTSMLAYAKMSDGKWTKVSESALREDSDDEADFWPIGPGGADGEIYVRARSPKDDRATIKVFDLRTSQLVRTEFAAPDADVVAGLTDFSTGEYIGASWIDDRYRIKMRDLALQRHVDAINRFFDDEANVYFENISVSADLILLRVSGPLTPQEYYLYDKTNARISPLFASYPLLTPELLSPVEAIEYEARDGMKIAGFVTHPGGDATKKAPLVVMPHGGPEARTVYGYDPLAQFLASRGYRVFEPNFRGSYGRGRKFAEAGYGEWGGKMQDDVTDGVRLLFAQGLAAPDKTCIVGASYGGYAALSGAVESADLYACAISIAGVSDLLDLMHHRRREEGLRSAVYEYNLKSIGDPDKHRAKLVARSPARNAARIDIPVLLIHGDKDDRVPIEQTETMMRALDKADRPYESLIIEGEGRSFRTKAALIEMFEKVEGFLETHIGGAN